MHMKHKLRLNKKREKAEKGGIVNVQMVASLER